MTDKKYIPILFCSAVLALIVSVGIMKSASRPQSRILPRVVHGPNGWGYDILVDGKVVIHQPVMPAHGGDLGFDNKTQALHAARLVISRMGNNDFPRLSKQEVDSINQQYPQ